MRKLLFICCITLLTANAHAATDNYTIKDFNHWLDAAYIADAAYGSSKLEQVLDRQGYKLTHLHEITGFAVSYFLATNDDTKQHILAVRGTANMENVMLDATFVLVHDKLTGIDIHQGFLLSSRDIYQKIKPYLKSGYKINTIGHSLGGATALTLAMMLDKQGYPIGEVITFGQPKVTNISGSQKFKHLKVTRIVTAKDIVPLVPPIDPMDLMKLSIFWHQGTEVILYKDNRYSVLNGVDSMWRATEFLNDIPGEQHINSHFMSTYIAYLKAKLKMPERIKFKNDFRFTDWFGSSQSSREPKQSGKNR